MLLLLTYTHSSSHIVVVYLDRTPGWRGGRRHVRADHQQAAAETSGGVPQAVPGASCEVDDQFL